MEESDGGSEIDLKIEVADDESSSHSDVDFVPAPPMPEPRHRNYRTEPTETVIPTVTVTQESGRDGTVWVENGDETLHGQRQKCEQLLHIDFHGR
uniref:Uncharacterized protein n=1 Tax=Oncorhynchus mykiss TaxID=8022 RepID=A0A8C7WGR8_ONCMY